MFSAYPFSTKSPDKFNAPKIDKTCLKWYTAPRIAIMCPKNRKKRAPIDKMPQVWSLVKFLKVRFGRDFAVKDWSTFWARSLGKIWKLKIGQESKGEFWPTCDMTFGESRQPLGLLCLWQCFVICLHKNLSNLIVVWKVLLKPTLEQSNQILA